MDFFQFINLNLNNITEKFILLIKFKYNNEPFT